MTTAAAIWSRAGSSRCPWCRRCRCPGDRSCRAMPPRMPKMVVSQSGTVLLARDDRLGDQTEHESHDDGPQPAHGCLLVRLDVSRSSQCRPVLRTAHVGHVRTWRGTAASAQVGARPGLERAAEPRRTVVSSPGRGEPAVELGWWNVMRKQSSGQVFRITGARQGLAEDVRGRQRRYVISMSIRTVSVILTAVLWNVERPVAIVTLVLGALLPYVAVVFANAGRENVDFAALDLHPRADPSGAGRGPDGAAPRNPPTEPAAGDHEPPARGAGLIASPLAPSSRKPQINHEVPVHRHRVPHDILRRRSASPVGATDRRRAAPPVAARRRHVRDGAACRTMSL